MQLEKRDETISSSSSSSSTSSSSSSTSSSSSSSSTLLSSDLSRSKSLYHVSAKPPTVVSHSLVCYFTSSTIPNLILVKVSRIEIFQLTASGLEPLLEIPIYGRISTLNQFRIKNENRDRLFITTESHKFAVLQYQEEKKEIITLASGDTRHKVGHPNENGNIVVIDPRGTLTMQNNNNNNNNNSSSNSPVDVGLHVPNVNPSLILLHQYDGILQVLTVDARGTFGTEIFDVRLDELQVLSLALLHKELKPVLLVLYQDVREKRYVKSYTIEMKEKELKPGPWPIINVDNTATHLITVSGGFGGCFVVSEEQISYYNNKNTMKSVSMRPTQILSIGMIDPTRYLLGDLNGNLMMLVLRHDDRQQILGLHLQSLGITSSARTLTYLDNSYVFVGSVYGDSQLIKLNSKKNEETGSFIDILETYDNLGSIVDMCVVDLDRQGQGQIVTCSGAYHNGSLRVIRNGIGIQEEASIELPGMKGIWNLKDPNVNHGTSEYDKYLVESFVGETRVLSIDEEELSECEIPGFQLSAQTLYTANLISSSSSSFSDLLQVTAEEVRLVDGRSLELKENGGIWKPSIESARITNACLYKNQLLLSITGAKLILLILENHSWKEIANLQLDV